MLVALSLTAIILLAVLAILVTTKGVQQRAVAQARLGQRLDCAQAGLELAKDYFISNYINWDRYLTLPQYYNPVGMAWQYNTSTSSASTFNQSPVATATQTAAPIATIWNTNGTLNTSNSIYTQHPELFADLDGDGSPDIYMYIRDNIDEIPPAMNNWMQDNDNRVYVGAVCISQTMRPRTASGSSDPSLMAAEGLLSYNAPSADHSQKTSGPSGSGNLN